jgi:hypothetical protein
MTKKELAEQMSHEIAPFCKCGCNQPVNWNLVKSKWNEFIKNHSSGDIIIREKSSKTHKERNLAGKPERVYKLSEEARQHMREGQSKVVKSLSKENLAKQMKDQIGPLCSCGCNQHTRWHRNKRCWREYIIGHGTRGTRKSEETRKKMTEANLKRWSDPNYKIKMSSVSNKGYKCGYREDLGHFVRSSWEANFARLMIFQGVEYKYEPKRFVFRDKEDNILGTYLPDFYLVDLGEYVEVKGWWDDFSKKKVDLFCSTYPDIKLHIIRRKEYMLLVKKFSHLILNWE